jgi:hypothetical protein
VAGRAGPDGPRPPLAPSRSRWTGWGFSFPSSGISRTAGRRGLARGHCLSRRTAPFFPWGTRLAELCEELFRHGNAAANIDHAASEVLPQAAALLCNLKAIHTAYRARLLDSGAATPGACASAWPGGKTSRRPWSGLPARGFSPAASPPPRAARSASLGPCSRPGTWTSCGTPTRLWPRTPTAPTTVAGSLCPGCGGGRARGPARPGPALASGGRAARREAGRPAFPVRGRRPAERHGASGQKDHPPPRGLRPAFPTPGLFPGTGRAPDISDAAVVLPDTGLLMPVLHHLPRRDVNISMGYPLAPRRSPADRNHPAPAGRPASVPAAIPGGRFWNWCATRT